MNEVFSGEKGTTGEIQSAGRIDAGRSRRPQVREGTGADTATRTMTGPVQDYQAANHRPGSSPLLLSAKYLARHINGLPTS